MDFELFKSNPELICGTISESSYCIKLTVLAGDFASTNGVFCDTSGVAAGDLASATLAAG